MRTPNYDKFPTIAVPDHANAAVAGWSSIAAALRSTDARHILVVETYPGTLDSEVLPSLEAHLKPALLIRSVDALKDEATIRDMTAHEFWAEDAVLGRMTKRSIRDFFDPARLETLQKQVETTPSGLILIYGIGASLIANAHTLVYADLARWEIQRRQRSKLVHGIGVNDAHESAWAQYKRGFFIDWRVADQHKNALWNDIAFFLDTNTPGEPKLVRAEAVRAGLKQCVARPFRVVPFFDPGVWGGQWMKEVCDLDRSAVNYAWCFDCVPEENSLLLSFGNHRIELPSLNLVFQHPRELLGRHIHERFGAEFPIRFDFLDTMDGGNLSLQVHPHTDYIRKTFNMDYTQDESYYLLDAKEDACVYLGFKSSIDSKAFLNALDDAQKDANKPLNADAFINKWPAKKHDHFLIPAGTIHCSGKNAMVLEISATPYIFTHKLWDWGRLDLDGKPRPISIHHGRHNLDYDRDTEWTKRELVNRFEPIAQGEGWREERTGLHASEFIETRRHWFTQRVEHDTNGTVNVLNLVEGDEAIVESPTDAFEPFVVHYAETWIVPAAIGRYSIRPFGRGVGQTCATMKAFVRES